MAVTTASFDGGAGASPDTFPGSAGGGWAGGFVQVGTAPTVTNANPLDGGTNYLSYTAQGAGATNIAREYDGSGGLDLTKAHTISWLFRFDAASLSQFTTFEDRLHFFANDGFTGAGGTSASNSWAIIAAGAQGGTIGDAPPVVGEFAFFDHNGTSDFTAANMVGTGIALTTGDVYAVTVTVDPARKQYSAVLTNQDTGETFSRSGMNFRNAAGTGAQFTDIHFGKNASSAGDAFPLSLDSIKIDVAKQIVANFTDGQNTDFADAINGKAGGGWNGAWSGVETEITLETSNPLNGVAGNPYISVGSDSTPAAASRTIRRQLDPNGFGEVNPGAMHKITWEWRFDGNIADFGGQFNDRIHFFGDAVSQNGTGATNTWAIGIVAADNGTTNDIHQGRWYFFDNNGSSAFSASNMFDTGLGLLAGAVYQFEVVVDPLTGTYSARIFDGINTVFAENLTFRNGAPTTGTFLHFGVNTSAAGDDFRFSLDSVTITAVIIPEPATLSMLALAGLALVRRKRRA